MAIPWGDSVLKQANDADDARARFGKETSQRLSDHPTSDEHKKMDRLSTIVRHHEKLDPSSDETLKAYEKLDNYAQTKGTR